MGILVLCIDCSGKGFRSLLKQGVHLVLLLLHKLKFELVGLLHGLVHVYNHKNVEQNYKAYNRKVLQRNSVCKKLNYNGKDWPKVKQNNRNPYKRPKPASVLHNNGKLHQKAYIWNYVADRKPLVAVIAVAFVKGIVKAGKLVNNQKDCPKGKKNPHGIKPFWSFRKIPLAQVQINKVQIKKIYKEKGKEKDHKVGNSNRPPAKLRKVSAENIGIAVHHQQNCRPQLYRN